MKYWIRMGMSIFFMIGVVSAHGQELDRRDAQFITEAAQAGAFEIEASQLAVRNGQHDDVKRYAHTMIADHTGVGGELKTLAAAKGVSLPSDLSSSQARALAGLQAETGTRFDLQYADDVAIGAHNDAVALFLDAAEHAKDPEVKAFAQQTLPNLKAHLDAGMALRKSLAASGKASPEESAPAAASPGTVSPASRQAPPNVLPGDKGAPKP